MPLDLSKAPSYYNQTEKIMWLANPTLAQQTYDARIKTSSPPPPPPPPTTTTNKSIPSWLAAYNLPTTQQGKEKLIQMGITPEVIEQQLSKLTTPVMTPPSKTEPPPPPPTSRTSYPPQLAHQLEQEIVKTTPPKAPTYNIKISPAGIPITQPKPSLPSTPLAPAKTQLTHQLEQDISRTTPSGKPVYDVVISPETGKPETKVIIKPAVLNKYSGIKEIYGKPLEEIHYIKNLNIQYANELEGKVFNPDFMYLIPTSKNPVDYKTAQTWAINQAKIYRKDVVKLVKEEEILRNEMLNAQNIWHSGVDILKYNPRTHHIEDFKIVPGKDSEYLKKYSNAEVAYGIIPPTELEVGKEQYELLIQQGINKGMSRSKAEELVKTKLWSVAMMSSPLAIDSVINIISDAISGKDPHKETHYKLAAKDIGYQEALDKGAYDFIKKVGTEGAMVEGVYYPLVTLGMGYGIGKGASALTKAGSSLVARGTAAGSKVLQRAGGGIIDTAKYGGAALKYGAYAAAGAHLGGMAYEAYSGQKTVGPEVPMLGKIPLSITESKPSGGVVGYNQEYTGKDLSGREYISSGKTTWGDVGAETFKTGMMFASAFKGAKMGIEGIPIPQSRIFGKYAGTKILPAKPLTESIIGEKLSKSWEKLSVRTPEGEGAFSGRFKFDVTSPFKKVYSNIESKLNIQLPGKQLFSQVQSKIPTFGKFYYGKTFQAHQEKLGDLWQRAEFPGGHKTFIQTYGGAKPSLSTLEPYIPERLNISTFKPIGPTIPAGTNIEQFAKASLVISPAKPIFETITGGRMAEPHEYFEVKESRIVSKPEVPATIDAYKYTKSLLEETKLPTGEYISTSSLTKPWTKTVVEPVPEMDWGTEATPWKEFPQARVMQEPSDVHMSMMFETNKIKDTNIPRFIEETGVKATPLEHAKYLERQGKIQLKPGLPYVGEYMRKGFGYTMTEEELEYKPLTKVSSKQKQILVKAIQHEIDMATITNPSIKGIYKALDIVEAKLTNPKSYPEFSSDLFYEKTPPKYTIGYDITLPTTQQGSKWRSLFEKSPEGLGKYAVPTKSEVLTHELGHYYNNIYNLGLKTEKEVTVYGRSLAEKGFEIPIETIGTTLKLEGLSKIKDSDVLTFIKDNNLAMSGSRSLLYQTEKTPYWLEREAGVGDYDTVITSSIKSSQTLANKAAKYFTDLSGTEFTTTRGRLPGIQRVYVKGTDPRKTALLDIVASESGVPDAPHWKIVKGKEGIKLLDLETLIYNGLDRITKYQTEAEGLTGAKLATKMQKIDKVFKDLELATGLSKAKIEEMMKNIPYEKITQKLEIPRSVSKIIKDDQVKLSALEYIKKNKLLVGGSLGMKSGAKFSIGLALYEPGDLDIYFEGNYSGAKSKAIGMKNYLQSKHKSNFIVKAGGHEGTYGVYEVSNGNLKKISDITSTQSPRWGENVPGRLKITGKIPYKTSKDGVKVADLDYLFERKLMMGRYGALGRYDPRTGLPTKDFPLGKTGKHLKWMTGGKITPPEYKPEWFGRTITSIPELPIHKRLVYKSIYSGGRGFPEVTTPIPSSRLYPEGIEPPGFWGDPKGHGMTWMWNPQTYRRVMKGGQQKPTLLEFTHKDFIKLPDVKDSISYIESMEKAVKESPEPISVMSARQQLLGGSELEEFFPLYDFHKLKQPGTYRQIQPLVKPTEKGTPLIKYHLKNLFLKYAKVMAKAKGYSDIVVVGGKTIPIIPGKLMKPQDAKLIKNAVNQAKMGNSDDLAKVLQKQTGEPTSVNEEGNILLKKSKKTLDTKKVVELLDTAGKMSEREYQKIQEAWKDYYSGVEYIVAGVEFGPLPYLFNKESITKPYIPKEISIKSTYEKPIYKEPGYIEPYYEPPTYEYKPLSYKPKSSSKTTRYEPPKPTYESPPYEKPKYEPPKYIYEQPYEKPKYDRPVYEQPTYRTPEYPSTYPRYEPPYKPRYNPPYEYKTPYTPRYTPRYEPRYEYSPRYKPPYTPPYYPPILPGDTPGIKKYPHKKRKPFIYGHQARSFEIQTISDVSNPYQSYTFVKYTPPRRSTASKIKVPMRL